MRTTPQTTNLPYQSEFSATRPIIVGYGAYSTTRKTSVPVKITPSTSNDMDIDSDSSGKMLHLTCTKCNTEQKYYQYNHEDYPMSYVCFDCTVKESMARHKTPCYVCKQLYDRQTLKCKCSKLF